jgi:ABC-type glutathione transport system ATPase component
MNAPVIRIRDLSTRFGEVWIHKGLNLDIERGEMVSLVGGSGSGKTTLLRMVIGLLLPDGRQHRAVRRAAVRRRRGPRTHPAPAFRRAVPAGRAVFGLQRVRQHRLPAARAEAL